MNETIMTDAKYQPTAIYGHDEHIAGLVRRMRFMIPGAQDAPAAIIWKAAQIAHMHRLDPFSGDIQIYSIYKNPPPDDPSKWILNIGISAWRRAAQRQAKYSAIFRPLTPEEIKAIHPNHHPADVGSECTLYRLDVARECHALGITYMPTVAMGIWRKHAYQTGHEWHADQIPNTETPASVATRRAEKKALKIAFSLDYPDDQNFDTQQWSVVEATERQLAQEERLRATPAKPEIPRSENGDILWA